MLDKLDFGCSLFNRLSDTSLELREQLPSSAVRQMSACVCFFN